MNKTDHGNDYYHFWGKARSENPDAPAYHLLVYHSLDVAAVGKIFLQKDTQLLRRMAARTNLGENVLDALVTFFLALHDLGKFAEGFQNIRHDLFRDLRGHTSTKDYTVRHDTLGYLLWNQAVWPGGWREGWLRMGDEESADMNDWGDVLSAWARAVTGHHGIPPRTDFHGMSLFLDGHFDAESREAGVTYSREAARLLLPQIIPLPLWDEQLELAFKNTSWLLSGLAVLSDWIGSNIAHFPYITSRMPLSDYWIKHALPQARIAVKESGVLPPPPSKSTGITTLFKHIGEPSPLQEHVSSCELSQSPELFILEDATGSGKTEAALTLAHRLMVAGLAEGMFMALPTMASANAIYDRLEHAYQVMYEGTEPPSLILAHGMRHLSSAFRASIGLENQRRDPSYADDDETASAHCVTWLADNRKKALLAAVGVGTIDQALLAVLPRRHQSLRLLGLARNVLIVDEVHAYDPYMHTLLRTLLHFHAAQGGSAILLSATLPQSTRQELADSFLLGLQSSPISLKESGYPLATHISVGVATEVPLKCRTGTGRTITIEMVQSEAAVERRILEVTQRGACACWIRNTVDDAIATYRRLTQSRGSEQLMLFHARFAMGDRLEIEREVLQKFGKGSKPEDRAGRILIATQVVEQSLDLDFDLLVTDLAPMDLIIQRAGRLHRHPRGERGNPTLMILAPGITDEPGADWYAASFPKAAYVYPSHGQLWLTARLLANRRQIAMPEDARNLVEEVFGSQHQDDIPKGLQARDLEADGKDRAAISVAQLNGLNLDAGYASTLNQWLEDTITPTRLGIPTTTARLARWDGSELTPWFSADKYAWDLSQVSVRQAWISGPAANSGSLKIAVEHARESMPDKCKWSVLIPLTAGKAGTWHGKASAANRGVSVIYHPQTGISIITSREHGDPT